MYEELQGLFNPMLGFEMPGAADGFDGESTASNGAVCVYVCVCVCVCVCSCAYTCACVVRGIAPGTSHRS